MFNMKSIRKEASFLTIMVLAFLTMNQSNNVFNFKIGLQKGIIELRKILEKEKKENERLKKILTDYKKDVKKEERLDPINILNKDLPKVKQIMNLSEYLNQSEIDNINTINSLKDILDSEQIQLKSLLDVSSDITDNFQLMNIFKERYDIINKTVQAYTEVEKVEGYDKYIENSYEVEYDEQKLTTSLRNLQILNNYFTFLRGGNTFQNIDWKN